MILLTRRRMAAATITLLTYVSVLSPLTTKAQTAQNTTTTYGYNATGQITRVTDPLGRVTDIAYDALDRLTLRTLPAPRSGMARPLIKYEYDGLDQVTSVTDPRNLITAYAVNGIGNQTALDSPDVAHTDSTYDLAGNRKTSVDARGKVSTYTYDALNRLTRINYSSGVATVFEYDGGSVGTSSMIGQLTRISDESGNTTFSYDSFGRIVSKTQTVVIGNTRTVHSVRYTYGTGGTANGKLASITYPSGNRVNFLYNDAGQLASLRLDSAQTSVNLLTGIFYTPFGAAQSWYWGNSTSDAVNGYARKFDLDGRITSYTLGNIQTTGLLRHIDYDAGGRIVGYTHEGSVATPTPALLDQTFAYDNLDRLIANQSYSTSVGYAYDSNGNRIQTTIGGSSNSNLIDTTSNRLMSTTGPTPAKRNEYDAAGNLATDGMATYIYSDRGRLSRVAKAGLTTDYLYNGVNQRVSKAGAAVTTGVNYFVYDEQGHLLGEYAADGTALQETVYLSDTPVAVLGASVSYVYADHLDTPRLITRSSDNAIIWRWDVADPFGVQPPLDNPIGAGTFTYNLRFPGQLFDRETNNYYNFYRYYDPQLGRYLQSDPIGLRGGVNTYEYVGGNPLSFIDSTGEQAIAAPVVIGGGLVACYFTPGCKGLLQKIAKNIISPKAKSPFQNTSDEEKVCPPRPDFDFNDPSVPPVGPDGKSWPWRGPDAPGGPRGGYVNPSNPDQSAHPDLSHPDPVGPHWDFTDRKTGGWRVYPDGTVRPK